MTSSAIWTAREAAAATKGRCEGNDQWTATGVSIDTRTLRAGDIFVALKGLKGDGHDHVATALARGASAVIVSRVPPGLPAGAPLLVVPDTLKAMEDMGRAARARTGAKIIGITGSVGKTGTKEMLAAALAAQGQTHASKASHNNHWGVPLSLSSLHAGCDYGVFEMGMNHAHEITPLSRMVRPDIVIITTVAAVHIENFANIQGIADAKSEIFDGAEPGGLAVLNRDNEWFDYLKARAEARGLRVFSFGRAAGCDARLSECLEAANGSRIRAEIRGQEVNFTLKIPGGHNAQNAMAVLLAVDLAGADIHKAAAALETIEPVAGRGRREYLDLGDPENPVTLIDESYNASPESMKASFRVLAMIDPGRGGRRMAFLGDMRELGPQAAQMHADLSLPLQAADVDLVYTCGPLMKSLHEALPPPRRGDHKNDSVELAAIVPDVLTPGDVVMVKGSNGSRMGVVVEALRALPDAIKKKTGGGLDRLKKGP